MIVCPQPLAAEVGVRVMKRGGNAVDAAVAAAFVQGVIDPTNCGIGGFGQLNVHMASTGDQKMIDFHARAGAKAEPDMWEDLLIEQAPERWGYVLKGNVNARGYESIGVPGTVMELFEGVSRFGTMSWRELIDPAAEIAAHGYIVSREDAIAWRAEPESFAPLQFSDETRRIYTKDGGAHSEGDIIANRDYAETLRRIATAGAESFYQGDIASRMADDLERGGALIRDSDLSGYSSRIYSPLTADYRGHTVASNDAPGGGITLLEILNILEEYELSKYNWRGIGSDVAEYIWIIAQAMRAAEKDRMEKVGDPAFVEVPTERLISKQNGAEWKDRIDSGEKIVIPRLRPREHPSTTHVSVVDEGGNAVSLTHTLGSSSGVITPGLGFMYNNAMINFNPLPGRPDSIAPGKSRNTQMAPTIVYSDGSPYLVVGAPGGSKILAGVSQTLVNIVDHRMSPFEAVAHPRIFVPDTGVIDVSSRIPSYVCAELEAKGENVVRIPSSYDDFASSQAIAVVAEGGGKRTLGGSDPRRKGAMLST